MGCLPWNVKLASGLAAGLAGSCNQDEKKQVRATTRQGCRKEPSCGSSVLMVRGLVVVTHRCVDLHGVGLTLFLIHLWTKVT